MRLLMLRSYWLAFFVLAPAAAWAQPEVTTFSDVPRVIEIGRKVVVTDEQGRKTKGHVSETERSIASRCARAARSRFLRSSAPRREARSCRSASQVHPTR